MNTVFLSKKDGYVKFVYTIDPIERLDAMEVQTLSGGAYKPYGAI